MSIEPSEKKKITLGDWEVEIGFVDYRKGREAIVLLSRMAGPAFAVASEKKDVTSVIDALVSHLDPDALSRLDDILMPVCHARKVGGAGGFQKLTDIAPAVFGGRSGLGQWLRWIRVAVEENFADFFQEIGNTFGDLLSESPEAKPESERP